jgi:hypothetical protein
VVTGGISSAKGRRRSLSSSFIDGDVIMILGILRGTPVWVFVLVTYLVGMGAARLRTRVTRVHRLWIMPAVFIGWGLYGLAQHGGAFPSALADWLMGSVAGLVLGGAPRQRLIADRKHGLVQQPPSVVPLLRNLGLFGAHYALNVAAAIEPALRAGLMRWDVVVSGLGAGYFIGWAARFVQSYRNAPESVLDVATREPVTLLESR